MPSDVTHLKYPQIKNIMQHHWGVLRRQSINSLTL